MQASIMDAARSWAGVCVVDIDDDVGRIDQHDQVLREIEARALTRKSALLIDTEPVSIPKAARTVAKSN
jgi:hypothetical protein